MDKSYNSKLVEEKWVDYWEKQGFFKANPASPKPAYSLLMPPPNLTGSLHLGHAMQHVILDAIARFKRMSGFDVLLLPGVDHAGIQFEGTLDRLLAKEDLSKRKLGREKWIERAWSFKEEIYQSFHQTWKVFGLSADWNKEVFTLEPKVQRAVFAEFKKFWDEDLLYKGAYIVQWCPKCGTAIEDVEMEYQPKKDKLYYLQYGPLVIATTRPETKFGDTAMAVHPDDQRYQQYIGTEVEIDTLNGKKKMRVIADQAIDPSFGTGAEKVTPGHDFLDYEIGKRHNLPILQIIDKQGRLTELAGKYAGMKADEARLAIIPDLKEKGILIKEEDYTHSVPVCERCKTVIQPIISEEWFVKITPLATKALGRVGEVAFFPQNYQQILTDWMEGLHDWSISRSLWWGHRIPVWYCQQCNPRHLVGKDKDMIVSLEEPKKDCQTCSKQHWVQDEQVLDTWFSSGMWPLATLGWPDNSGEWEKMQKYFPWSFELSSGEIKYLWIARMIMLSLHFSDQIPFKNMFFHGQIRDLQGRKFSKSLGNGIDPNQLRADWGTDATRMALYGYSAPGRDGRANKQTIDERAKNYRNFTTKIWNIAKFVLETKPSTDNGLNESKENDQWILKQLDQTIAEVTKNLEKFQLHLAAEALYEFIWHKFADVYLEKSKFRRNKAQPTLERVLKTCLVLLHPFMPFLTEEIYQQLTDHKDSIMLEIWPT